MASPKLPRRVLPNVLRGGRSGSGHDIASCMESGELLWTPNCNEALRVQAGSKQFVLVLTALERRSPSLRLIYGPTLAE